jgi:hypothetical protein
MIPRVQKGGGRVSWFGRVEDDKQTKQRNHLPSKIDYELLTRLKPSSLPTHFKNERIVLHG